MIGIAGAVLMSLMMQHLAEFRVDRDRSPYCQAVESRLGAKRLGPVRIDEVIDGESLFLTVHARVMTGLHHRRIANSAGSEVWLGALRAGVKPDRVTVILVGPDGGEGQAFEVPPPPRRSTKKIVTSRRGFGTKSAAPTRPKSELVPTPTAKVGASPRVGR